MGKRGPQKKPAAAKRRDGTYRKDRDTGVELPAGVPDPPDWLGPEGRAEWERRVPQLAAAGLISTVDQVTFGLWCQAYEQLVRALREIEANEGFVAYTDKGNVIQHPVVGVLHKARGDLLKIAAHFGLSPSARAGLNLGGEGEEEDPLAALEQARSRETGAGDQESRGRGAKKKTTKGAKSAKTSRKKPAKKKRKGKRQ